MDGWSGHNWNSANIEKVGLNNLWPDGKIDLVRFFLKFFFYQNQTKFIPIDG